MTLPVFCVNGVLNGLNGGIVSEILTPQNGEESSQGRPALVLDTNTVLALWMFRDPKLEALREWIEAGNCRLHSREDALEELRHVLAYRQFGLDPTTRAQILDAYRARTALTNTDSENATIFPALPRCQDGDDQKFLEIARSSTADHLLTRDKALLRLRRHSAIRSDYRIERPEDFQLSMVK